MDFRVMDETVVFEGHGLTLLVNDDCGCVFSDGCRIRDINGAVHLVEHVTRQEDLTCLFIRNGDAAYFDRLFRNIRVDATLFVLLERDE
ncbi:MAG TPA: hypothetical protein PKN45_04275 [Candidatus Limiplasma sp.]|mgnify:FL=1|jgi:hypothetical protein|nr:hypothetical protein [Candidatus Limiplasma sp.]HPR78705.1 hypothetical protein [Candidatus Limiplasma sp.]